VKPLVFIHGWAQSRQIWFQQNTVFSEARFLNLPGHGGAPDAEAGDWLEALATQLPDEPCVLVGWSLGGMLAMQLATAHPERVAGLALVASTPRFRATHSWPHGSHDAVFDGFREAVESGSMRALNRFFALMLHGDTISRADYNRLAKAGVDRDRRVSDRGLAAGLALLQQLDLREQIAGVIQPTLIIHGETDAIVPAAAGRWLADNIRGAARQIIPECGHAPFLTRPEQFNAILEKWWQQRE